jgi:hypothetical protein
MTAAGELLEGGKPRMHMEWFLKKPKLAKAKAFVQEGSIVGTAVPYSQPNAPPSTA